MSSSIWSHTMPHVFLDSFRRAGEAQSARVSETPTGPWLGLMGHCPAITRRLERALDTTSNKFKLTFFTLVAFVDYTGRNFGQVFFCNNPISGYLILTGLVVSNRDTALSALMASTLSLIVARGLSQPRSLMSVGLLGSNAVLLGAVLPTVLDMPNMWYWPLICGSAALSVVLSSSLGQALGSLRPPLPVISLPFVLLGALSALLLLAASPLPPLHTTPHNATITLGNASKLTGSHFNFTQVLSVGEQVLQGGFLGVGQVLGVRNWWCSGLVLLAIFLCSPLLALVGLLGSYIATCIGALAGEALREAATIGHYGYNGLLASCAICFFFVPTWRSALLALAAVSLTSALQLVLESPLQHSGVPLLLLPYVAATLLVVGASSDGLPRATLLSYPELHRSLWLRARREERRDTRHSISLGMQAPSTLQMSNSTTSMVLDSSFSSNPRGATLELPCSAVYRPTDGLSDTSSLARSVSPPHVPCTPMYQRTGGTASVTFDPELVTESSKPTYLTFQHSHELSHTPTPSVTFDPDIVTVERSKSSNNDEPVTSLSSSEI